METIIDNIKDDVKEASKYLLIRKKKIVNDALARLDILHETMDKQKSRITNLNEKLTSKEVSYEKINEKHTLVSSLLTENQVQNEGYIEFKKLLNGEFLDFANEEDSLANEAEALLNLQSIEKELSAVVAFPDLYTRNIVAIGGGFSSGKSQFVSSFFEKEDISLPIGIEPVTAIPTYVVSQDRNSIKGYSAKGGLVSISEELYQKMSHEYIKSFQFNLKDIMPFMMISTPLNKEYFDNICLIDTPGYNPAITDGFTGEDEKTSMDYLDSANSILWLIGADSNGTIPATDLEFLSNLDLTNKDLFIVFNKADLRSADDLEDIMEIIEESLEDYDINFSGISAYSSVMREEYSYINISLFDFLVKENRESSTRDDIEKKISCVFDMYKKSITEKIAHHKSLNKYIKEIELDMLENSLDEDALYTKVSDLKKFVSYQELEENLVVAQEIEKKFLNAVDLIFKDLKNDKVV